MSFLSDGISQAVKFADPRQGMAVASGLENQLPVPGAGKILGMGGPQAGAVGSGADDMLGAARRRKAGLEGGASMNYVPVTIGG